MEALIIVDAQNEFAADGKRPVTNHQDALAAIAGHVEHARASATNCLDTPLQQAK
jgi:nicotinamidase-related amidase